MKRYYMSFKGHGFMIIILSAISILNSVLFFIGDRDYTGFMGIVYLFNTIFWFALGLIFLYQIYKIYIKKIYLEISEQNINYKFMFKEKIFEYADAEFYTAKQSHGGYVVYYKSISEGQKKAIPLNIFNVDYKECLRLISEYSRKDVFIKEYGEDIKLFEITE